MIALYRHYYIIAGANENDIKAGWLHTLIDLHSHILPGVDDGARDLAMSLEMARMAVEDGIEVMACTPHFMPGVYDNESRDIIARITQFQNELDQAGIALTLVSGCDAHIRPDFLECLQRNAILPLNGSRYVLFEPPHITAPQRIDDLLFNLTASGFMPILTHPERLKWIQRDYGFFERLCDLGILVQVTAGSLTGRFGPSAQSLAMRMLGEGRVHIVASDAHNLTSRPPIMSDALEICTKEMGLDEAQNLVLVRPSMILDNKPVDHLPAISAFRPQAQQRPSLLQRIFRG